MVYPLINRMLKDGILSDAHWISLNPTGPETIKAGRITLHSINLEKDRLSKYGHVKEAIWGAAHGTSDDTLGDRDIFWSDEFSEYAYYNRLTSELIRKLDEEHDFDIFYIHDFQQLPIGHMLATLKPKIFRWHIPFDESMLPEQWTEPLATYFNSYDVVIASSGPVPGFAQGAGLHRHCQEAIPLCRPERIHQASKGGDRGDLQEARDRRERPGAPDRRPDGPDEGPGQGDKGPGFDHASVSKPEARPGRERQLLQLEIGAGALEI